MPVVEARTTNCTKHRTSPNRFSLPRCDRHGCHDGAGNGGGELHGRGAESGTLDRDISKWPHIQGPDQPVRIAAFRLALDDVIGAEKALTLNSHSQIEQPGEYRAHVLGAIRNQLFHQNLNRRIPGGAQSANSKEISRPQVTQADEFRPINST